MENHVGSAAVPTDTLNPLLTGAAHSAPDAPAAATKSRWVRRGKWDENPFALSMSSSIESASVIQHLFHNWGCAG